MTPVCVFPGSIFTCAHATMDVHLGVIIACILQLSGCVSVLLAWDSAQLKLAAGKVRVAAQTSMSASEKLICTTNFSL